MFTKDDENYMYMALSMAKRALGHVAPNPAVGCVIVKRGVVLAAAHTGRGGRPHAETIALEQAGSKARGATVYVSLEPCAHQGQTGPCALALIEAGVARVVVACEDPDTRVAGKGMRMMKETKIVGEFGLLEQEAKALNTGFFLKVQENRPLVTLKVATSKDNKIAKEPGTRTQISGDLASRYMHLTRSRHDAILVGIDTVLADDPRLTSRFEGHDHVMRRVILDTNLRIPAESQLVQDTSNDPLVIFHDCDDDAKIVSLREKGVLLIRHDPKDIKGVLGILAGQGITRLLVEGGAKVHESFLNAGFVDRFLWCKSPVELGPQGVDALHMLNINDIEAISGLKKQKTKRLGEDLLEMYA